MEGQVDEVVATDAQAAQSVVDGERKIDQRTAGGRQLSAGKQDLLEL